MKTLFQIIEDLAALSVEELQAFVEASRDVATKVAENPTEFVSEERSAKALMAEMTAGVAAIADANAELERRAEAGADVEPPAEEPEIDTAALAELAARAKGETEENEEEEPETPAEPPAEEAAAPAEEAAEESSVVATIDPESLSTVIERTVSATVEAVTAAAAKKEAAEAEAKEARPSLGRLARPTRSRRSEPLADEERIAMTAAAENLGFGLGDELPDEMAIARMMVDKHRQIGKVPEGTHGDQVPIAKADWTDQYPEDRRLLGNIEQDLRKIEAVTAAGVIRDSFEQRRKENPSALVASGGLCAPVTPYYQLQMLSVADRPVRSALPSFNADRGGINVAAPAALTAIDEAVGRITEAQDAAGGASGTKTCQVIDCPPFAEVDVASIYHCLEFGNLGARAFPELVAQWNDLVLAAHARKADGALLDGIRAASTKVTAGNGDGLGASAQIPSQIITAAAAMRSRHRMDPEAVLRVLLPDWVLEMLVSDVFRSQFGRFDMTEDDFVALLRANDIEPTFYIDGATGRSQIFGAQSAGALLEFPATCEWYLYPEGSFLYLDGGTLELGLVRDSVLNATNDFQIFGETWENIAFVGVESLAVTTTVGDTGTVTLPVAVGATISY